MVQSIEWIKNLQPKDFQLTKSAPEDQLNQLPIQHIPHYLLHWNRQPFGFEYAAGIVS